MGTIHFGKVGCLFLDCYIFHVIVRQMLLLSCLKLATYKFRRSFSNVIICFSLVFVVNMKWSISETNRGKKSLLYDGFTYRIDSLLKSGDISWRCTFKTCKARLKCCSSPVCSSLRISLDGLSAMSLFAFLLTETRICCLSTFLASVSWLCSVFADISNLMKKHFGLNK
jgi:hypothetical protein